MRVHALLLEPGASNSSCAVADQGSVDDPRLAHPEAAHSTGPAEPDQRRMAPRMASRPSHRCCAVVGKDDAVAALTLHRPAAWSATLVRTIVDLVLPSCSELVLFGSSCSGRARIGAAAGVQTHNLPPRHESVCEERYNEDLVASMAFRELHPKDASSGWRGAHSGVSPQHDGPGRDERVPGRGGGSTS